MNVVIPLPQPRLGSRLPHAPDFYCAPQALLALGDRTMPPGGFAYLNGIDDGYRVVSCSEAR
jgi:hypothetical protein